ncbi:unnamed protein product [Rangifer tarandus platyrhynchus]|uniref:Uncharacterized protein n=1 Tax=Rangifer tarandus platyrhynchus TaxID=3082113 RepID=A0ABN9A6J4_RANTA|nr:unnamed protein product [Rangifer tarandus platyrhynchus]
MLQSIGGPAGEKASHFSGEADEEGNVLEKGEALGLGEGQLSCNEDLYPTYPDYPTSKFRVSSREELPHVRDKAWQLHFLGVAMKRSHTSKIIGQDLWINPLQYYPREEVAGMRGYWTCIASPVHRFCNDIWGVPSLRLDTSSMKCLNWLLNHNCEG